MEGLNAPGGGRPAAHLAARVARPQQPHAGAQAGDGRALRRLDAQLGALNEQRSTFGGIGSKLTEIAAASPQINAMIGYLARRKKRDKLVLGAVIGLCSGSLLWYSMS